MVHMLKMRLAFHFDGWVWRRDKPILMRLWSSYCFEAAFVESTEFDIYRTATYRGSV